MSNREKINLRLKKLGRERQGYKELAAGTELINLSPNIRLEMRLCADRIYYKILQLVYQN